MYLGCNLSAVDSSVIKVNERTESSNISDCGEPPDLAAKRRFFKQKSQTILGPDAFNEAHFKIRDDRNVLGRSESCDSPTKRCKNNENQNRKQYFSNLKPTDIDQREDRSLPSESCAKSAGEDVSGGECLEVTAEVHQSQHPPELRLASLASIDEILEFEQQEMALLETGMRNLSTVESVV